MRFEQAVQRPLGHAAVAHARKDVEPLDGDPVGRAFVAEQLAPAAGARRLAEPFAVTDRAGSGDDIDPVGPGQ